MKNNIVPQQLRVPTYIPIYRLGNYQQRVSFLKVEQVVKMPK